MDELSAIIARALVQWLPDPRVILMHRRFSRQDWGTWVPSVSNGYRVVVEMQGKFYTPVVDTDAFSSDAKGWLDYVIKGQPYETVDGAVMALIMLRDESGG